eukprot:5274897-Karenia_brevis.AAC.1
MLHEILRAQSGTADKDAGATRAKQEQARTIKRTRALWAGDQASIDPTHIVDTSGDKPSLCVAEYGKLARSLGKQHASEAA